MQLSRRSVAWAVWLAVVLGLFNSCAGHRECRESGQWLVAGGWAPTPATGIRALRALGTDDNDIQRYHAYANAILGLPYQATYVRPLEGWKVDARTIDEKTDAADPDATPPVVPARPLVPYKDFLVEYPPGFFLFAIPPAIFVHGMDSYYWVFSSLMALLLTAALALLWDSAKRIAPGRAEQMVFFTAACALAVGPILVRRYDAVVSLSLCMLVWGCVTKRAWAAGLGFGLGVAAKGMPLVLAPIALAYFLSERRLREALWTGLIAAALVVASVIPFARSAGAHMLDMFSYHGTRPLQVESTGGALLVFGRFFDPAFASVSQTYGSTNVVGAWDGPLKLLASVLPLAALVTVYVLGWRDMRRAVDDAARARVLLRGFCAALAFFMVLGKVFSPQYLTWLLPMGVLASLLDDRLVARRELLFALVLTQMIFPFCYCIGFASSLNPIFGTLVLARNLLVFAWGWQMAKGSRVESEARSGAFSGEVAASA
jgi:hypothetical protein